MIEISIPITTIIMIGLGIAGLILIFLVLKKRIHLRRVDKKTAISLGFVAMVLLGLFSLYGEDGINVGAIMNIFSSPEDAVDSARSTVEKIVATVKEKTDDVRQNVENVNNKITDVKNEISDVADAVSRPLDQAKKTPYRYPDQKNQPRYVNDPIYITPPNINEDLVKQIEDLKKENEQLKSKGGC